jgi:RHS repeat-associated protein
MSIARGMMKRTTNLDGGAETKSVYDGLGQRVRQTAGGETHHFVYDIAGQIVAEYGPLGWERDRVYRGGQLLATDEAVGTCRKTVEQFVEAFFRGSLDRSPTPAESQAWAGRLRDARSRGPAALLAEAKALGRTPFESADYAARGRADGEFVNDLYWAYLQRVADADGYLHWLEYTRVNGRAATITAFGESIEFAENVGGLCPDGEVTGELHWVFSDHVGSVRVITNSQGATIGRRDNLPFGDALRDVADAQGSAPQAAGALSAGSATTSGLWSWSNSIRTMFAETERDVATGLEHTPFRKYESGFGRWTSPDPYPGSMNAGNPQSFNRYAYVQNDPVNFVDPSGLNLQAPGSGCGNGGVVVQDLEGNRYCVVTHALEVYASSSAFESLFGGSVFGRVTEVGGPVRDPGNDETGIGGGTGGAFPQARGGPRRPRRLQPNPLHPPIRVSHPLT